MTSDRIETSRHIAAAPAAIFSVLTRPSGHVAIDSSGMLQAADGDPVGAVGDEFVVHMDRESLGDRPLGKYDVTVTISRFEADRLLEWSVGAFGFSVGHVYGYRLDPADGGTLVTSYCDWSAISDDVRKALTFPVIPEFALRATLGILARTVEPPVAAG